MNKWVSAILLAFLVGVASIVFSNQYSHAASVTASIDWATPIGRTATRLHYGLNTYQYSDPTIAGNPGNPYYKANVAFMNPGIVRLHNANQMEDSTTSRLGWVFAPATASYSWDAAKIANALQGAYNGTPIKMLNIANWPAYMDDGTGKLNPSLYDAYANFCAELVRIVNFQLGTAITYWEVINEKDHIYGDDMASLALIFNKAYDAMKSVDPLIQIGGPAFENPYNTSKLNAFIAATKDRLDFISYHTYSSTNLTTTKADVWNSASRLGYIDGLVSNITGQVAPERASTIATFHNEFNIERTITSEPWIKDTTSLIYDALAIRSMIYAGVTGTMAWNEGDEWWGKLDDDPTWTPRPASSLYKMLNEHVLGTMVNSASSNNLLLEVWATRSNESPQRAIVLINRSQADQSVQLGYFNWDIPPENNTPVAVYQGGINGYSTATTTHASLISPQGYLLPADTVTVLEYYPAITSAQRNDSTNPQKAIAKQQRLEVQQG